MVEHTSRKKFNNLFGAKRDKTLSILKKYERMYSCGKSSRTSVVSNTVYQFVGSSIGVEIFFKKREHKKERCFEKED